jgi:isoquinoline 1-oxidoreductase beta subunit
VALRLKLLTGAGANAGSDASTVGGAKRQAEVVRRAARSRRLGQAAAQGHRSGLATSFGQERDMPTWVACVARESMSIAPAAWSRFRS